MKKNYKKHIILLPAMLALGTLVLIHLGKKPVNTRSQHDMAKRTNEFAPAQPLTSPTEFNNYIDLLTSHTWQDLTTTTGITKEQCFSFQRQDARDYKTSIHQSNKRKRRKKGTVSLKTKKLIHDILQEYAIDPSMISIIPYIGHGSPAAADDYTIFIDERELATFEPVAQRFIIAHEIAHIKNKDHSLESALENLVNNRDKMHRRAKHNIARTSELRADVHAMLKGQEYAKGGISFFKTLLDRRGDRRNASHPRNSERLYMATHLDAMYQKQLA